MVDLCVQTLQRERASDFKDLPRSIEQKQEKKMYKPLVSPYHLGHYITFTLFPVSKLAIFCKIENTTSTYNICLFHRQAVCTSEQKLHDKGRNFTSDICC
jgi:hypothetical protein